MNKVFKSTEGRGAVLSLYDRALQESGLDLITHNMETPLGKTHVLEYGNPDNPPLLLIHGTGSSAAFFLYALPELAVRYHVFLPDIPGEPGKSEDSRFSCRGDGFSRWLQAILETLSIEKVHMAGQSLGAWASLRFALDHPERVKSVRLISPSGLASPKISYIPLFIWSLARGDKGVKDMIARLHNSSAEEISPEEMEAFRVMMKHCRPREEAPPLFTDTELSSLAVPLLYLAGDKDILLNTEKSVRRLKSLVPGAVCSVYPDGGHALTLWRTDFMAFDC
ncbi:MAG: alpha/beta hydrolase [Spirochaetales bacterium]|nr:alpha/beta hydrolase [Spirochaetales bacterium]